ncbi:Gti1/Pac2 family-domain-containing protein [Vararia minispora EC-137]|uniref:Gti1/Pac2 family-domain-containing protein n=1 Tax=Vararia minispora EC-137 TaxID=1314806 RepID=A0ACB8Q6I9_9AGAM|nr:Gti1/Pac2 family-domain-containing protein [Vararia minispora EC-137]
MAFSNTRAQVQSGHTTHPALHIRDSRDAHILLEAVRLKILPLITRRLSTNEREQLSSGNVFVWEEADFKGGLERWTDGRRWSQSRMRGDYLFYEEKIETTQEEREIKAARRAQRALDPGSVPPAANRRQDRPSKPDGLTKQTYSTLVYLPGSSSPRKWHIVAYFQGNDYSRLPVVDNYDYLRSLRVPEGVYVSNRGAGKPLASPASDGEDDDGSIYAGFRASQPPSSPTVSSSSSTYSHSSAGSSHYTYAPLPRLSTVVPMHSTMGACTTHPQPTVTRHSKPYAPLSAEDRRVLNSFRVQL